MRRDRLRQPEFDTLIDPDNDLAFSSVSIWELRIKWERRFVSGERKGEASPVSVLEGLREVEVSQIDLTPDLAACELLSPIAHSDPFDALLLTVAQQTERRLLTRDDKLRGHPLAFHAD
jgi:PIN domain nuclease of toxin-antitoxin system